MIAFTHREREIVRLARLGHSDDDILRAVQVSMSTTWAAGLSLKRRKVVYFVQRGMKNREVAFELCTNVQVIKNDLREICKKLGARTRMDLIRIDPFPGKKYPCPHNIRRAAVQNLDDRQKRVMRLKAFGLSDKDAANELGVTFKEYRALTNIFNDIGVFGRSDYAALLKEIDVVQ
ncbi:MAG TPA: hypothetical protein VMU07_04020 [Candidatus Paceibacterota bacterium]|nr:hypothetical protein [Candidatus Paceibacterota bacterium]